MLLPDAIAKPASPDPSTGTPARNRPQRPPTDPARSIPRPDTAARGRIRFRPLPGPAAIPPPLRARRAYDPKTNGTTLQTDTDRKPDPILVQTRPHALPRRLGPSTGRIPTPQPGAAGNPETSAHEKAPTRKPSRGLFAAGAGYRRGGSPDPSQRSQGPSPRGSSMKP